MCEFFSFCTEPEYHGGQRFYFDWNYRSKHLDSIKYRKKELCELLNEHWNSITDHLSQCNQTLTELLKSYRNEIQQTQDKRSKSRTKSSHHHQRSSGSKSTDTKSQHTNT